MTSTTDIQYILDRYTQTGPIRYVSRTSIQLTKSFKMPTNPRNDLWRLRIMYTRTLIIIAFHNIIAYKRILIRVRADVFRYKGIPTAALDAIVAVVLYIFCSVYMQ